MKFCLALFLVCTFIAGAFSWWDNGHMLVGEVAKSYMNQRNPKSARILIKLLSKWEKDFPNTSDISTSSIWADLIKCNKNAAYCPSPLLPSVKSFDPWHYSGIELNIDGGIKNNVDEDLFKRTKEGQAHNVLEDTIKTFKTTKSIWSANLMLRYFIHIFGDIHQPLHTTDGVSSEFPKGDRGGNNWKFQKPCSIFNLHALWDSTAGRFTTNWNMDMGNMKKELEVNATLLIKEFGSSNFTDSLKYNRIQDLSYDNFTTLVLKDDIFRQAIEESYGYSKTHVYQGLELSVNENGYAPCPPKTYFDKVYKFSAQQIHLGGYRLSFVLEQLAKQVEDLGLVRDHC